MRAGAQGRHGEAMRRRRNRRRGKANTEANANANANPGPKRQAPNPMWYVIQVKSGQERKARDLIQAAAGITCDESGRPVLKECFIPRYQVEQKFQGAYRTTERTLFPGYVIAVTSNVGALNGELKKVPAFTRLLGGGEAFVPLDRSEMALIDRLSSEGNRTVAVSRAVAEGDSVKVVKGPLVGCEGWIQKVNRRKGTCFVETEMFGRTLRVEIGLAVVSEASLDIAE